MRKVVLLTLVVALLPLFVPVGHPGIIAGLRGRTCTTVPGS